MAIRSVEAYPSVIKSGNEMLEHPGIGPKTAEKIQEIIDTVGPSEVKLMKGESQKIKR